MHRISPMNAARTARKLTALILSRPTTLTKPIHTTASIFKMGRRLDTAGFEEIRRRFSERFQRTSGSRFSQFPASGNEKLSDENSIRHFSR